MEKQKRFNSLCFQFSFICRKQKILFTLPCMFTHYCLISNYPCNFFHFSKANVLFSYSDSFFHFASSSYKEYFQILRVYSLAPHGFNISLSPTECATVPAARYCTPLTIFWSTCFQIETPYSCFPGQLIASGSTMLALHLGSRARGLGSRARQCVSLPDRC